MKLILVRGIQASGKTTWAKQWVSEDPEHRVRISYDDARRECGVYWIPSREHYIRACTIEKLRLALTCGYDVVIDNMNLSPNSVQAYILMAEVYGAKIENVEFRTPLEVCLERDSKRTGDERIGEDVIRATYERYKWWYECKFEGVKPLNNKSND